jgi:hypothetical protein
MSLPGRLQLTLPVSCISSSNIIHKTQAKGKLMNEKNPCKRIVDGEPPAKVLLDTAKRDLKTLRGIGSELDGNEMMRLGVITSESIRASAVESTVLQGFLLDLYQIATAQEKQLFKNMLEDIEISRTQAYRSIAVWRKLGPRLVSEPKVMRRFVPEAMKLICEEKYPTAARDEVVDLANRGQTWRKGDSSKTRNG